MSDGRPEAPPIARGEIVPDALCKRISEHPRLSADGKERLICLVRERDAFGRAKYGQPLMSEDGRNGVVDARQELGDLVQYVCKVSLAPHTTTETERAALRVIVQDALILVDDMLVDEGTMK